MTDRGQAHTLEAFSAGIIILGSIAFALQVTAVTPLTGSTASQHIENQQESVARGLLDAATRNDTLVPTILFWNDTAGRFHGVDSTIGTYASGGPPTLFGESLNETFLERGVAFDLTILYVSSTGSLNSKPVVNLGVPSDNAVRATRTVTLYDDDVLYHANNSRSGTNLTASNSFYMPDATNSSIYNVARVEVVVWRL